MGAWKLLRARERPQRSEGAPKRPEPGGRRAAIEYAVEKNSEPIFAYVSYPNAHLPLQPPTELLQRRNATLLNIPNHDRKNFAALMMNADESLANLTNRGLKATGLYDTAVIVVASDNGGQVSAMGGGSNYPLRGEKKYLFEGGVRAHAVIHSPLLPRAARGSSYGKLMHMSDWLPTLLQGALGASADELAGLKLPRGVVNDYGAIDGVDHWAHVTGVAAAAAAAPRDELLLNIDYLDGSGDYLGYFRAALIISDWKFIYNEKNISWFAPSDEPNFHLNNIHVSGRLTALYNVTADPGERNDLKSHYPAQTTRDGSPLNFESYPIGTILEVAPHHSCAATHQHAECHVVRDEFSGLILDSWPICKGW